MPTTNEEIAEVFDNMASLLEMKGDSIFKIRAYQRAARTVENLPFTLEQAVRDGMDLKSIAGIGDAISKKIEDLVINGKVEAYERLKAELPDGVLTLMNVPGVGPKTALRIAQESGANTLEEMEKAILHGRLASLPGMGDTMAQNIVRHIRSQRANGNEVPVGDGARRNKP